jgi:RNA polymerase sigma factor (sigma-70 family)
MKITTDPPKPSDAQRRQAVLSAMGRGPTLLRYAARYSPSLQDAEDAYQRAMVIALTKAPTVEGDGFMAWLHTVLRHEAIAIARMQAREGPAPGADVAESLSETLETPVAVDTIAAWRERYRALDEALDGLTEAQRVCLILQCAGESYDRIHMITGYSLRKIERSVLEGRRALRHWQVELIEGAVCERMGPLIERAVAGDADRRERRRVSKHVAHCGSCRGRMRHERELASRLGALAPLPLLGASPVAVPDPGHALAWWDRLTQSATVHTGAAAQAVTDLSGSGAARIGAGGVAVVLAGAASLPLVVDAVNAPQRPAERPALVRATAAVASREPVTTPARPHPAPVRRMVVRPAREAPTPRVVPHPRAHSAPAPAPAPHANPGPPAPPASAPSAPAAPAAAVSLPAPAASPPPSLALEFGP